MGERVMVIDTSQVDPATDDVREAWSADAALRERGCFLILDYGSDDE